MGMPQLVDALDNIQPIEVKNRILKISIDQKNFKINVCGFQIDPMLTLPSNENDFDRKFHLIKCFGVKFPEYICNNVKSYKPHHEFVLQHLGPAFNRRITAISYREFIEPLGCIEKYARRNLSVNRFEYPLEKVKALYRARKEVEQAEKDGMHVIIPSIIALEKPPSELKKIFGKSIWCQLLKSSMAQNKRIAWMLDVCWGGHIPVDKVEQMRSIVSIMLQARAWVQDWWLRSHYCEDLYIHYLKWMNINGIREKSNHPTPETLAAFDDYKDTCHLAERYYLPLRVPQTIAATKRWHDELIRKNVVLLTDSRERFDWYPPNANNDIFSVDLGAGVSAQVTILTSPFMIAKEGVEMHHCVAGRIWHVENRACFIAHINCGDERATVQWDAFYPFEIDEISGPGNSEASDNCLVAARKAKAVLKKFYWSA